MTRAKVKPLALADIVAAYLCEHDYDGLYSDQECACVLGDLMPCGTPSPDCAAGYKQPCDCGDHDWHVGER
jgi:hypothetical protein